MTTQKPTQKSPSRWWLIAAFVGGLVIMGLIAVLLVNITTRKAAQRRFVDLHMHMPASWTLGRAAAVRTSVEQALMSAVPGLRATIQLLPSDVEAHFDDERDLI